MNDCMSQVSQPDLAVWWRIDMMSSREERRTGLDVDSLCLWRSCEAGEYKSALGTGWQESESSMRTSTREGARRGSKRLESALLTFVCPAFNVNGRATARCLSLVLRRDVLPDLCIVRRQARSSRCVPNSFHEAIQYALGSLYHNFQPSRHDSLVDGHG